MTVNLLRLGSSGIRRHNMCTTCNVVKHFKDISEMKYFGDLNCKKRQEIIRCVCGVGHDTADKYARKI
jgi:hypothetical protein